MINQIRLVFFAWGGCFVGPSALTLGRRTLDVLLKILLLAAQNTRIDRSAKAHSERTDPIAPKKRPAPKAPIYPIRAKCRPLVYTRLMQRIRANFEKSQKAIKHGVLHNLKF